MIGIKRFLILTHSSSTVLLSVLVFSVFSNQNICSTSELEPRVMKPVIKWNISHEYTTIITTFLVIRTSFYHCFHNSRVQYTSTADILVMKNTVSLYASKHCTTWMCAVEELIYNDQIVFQLHRPKQSSPGITSQWHTAVLMWPSYFIYQHKYQ